VALNKEIRTAIKTLKAEIKVLRPPSGCILLEERLLAKTSNK
jgi:hypothetical protein